MERTIEIDVGEHTSDLVKNLYNAREEGRLCDVTIKVGSKKITCHKIVLSEGCEFFRGMFAHRMMENESGVAEMEDVDSECMMMCIQYIYTGKVSIPGGKVLELLQAAHMLQLMKLCDRVALCLEERLDFESFFTTRKIANTLSLTRLEETCNKFAMENFQSIAAVDDFKNLEKKDLLNLIRSKENKADEPVKCKALLVWSNSDVESRTEIFEKSFLSLDFSKMPKDYLSHLFKNEELVFNSAKCLRTLMRFTSDMSDVPSRDVNLGGADRGPKNNAIAVFDKSLKTVEAFNLEGKTWKQVKNLPMGFVEKLFSTVVVGDIIYVLASDKSNYKLRYADPSASWVRLPERTFTTEVTAVAFGGSIYAFDDDGYESKTIEKLGTAATFWSKVCDKSIRGCGSAIVAAEDFIYCIGGYDGAYLNNVARFEPCSGTWATMPPMPTQRSRAAAAHLDAKIYVVGGNNRLCLKTNECFDIATRSWSSLTGLHQPFGFFQICLVQEKIYAVGRRESGNVIEEYDPAVDEWKVVETMTGKTIQSRASVSLKI